MGNSPQPRREIWNGEELGGGGKEEEKINNNNNNTKTKATYSTSTTSFGLYDGCKKNRTLETISSTLASSVFVRT